jgi:carbonic anhydrase/acetyltransferase-like protein (isoleucine patch superfamily)
MMPTNWMLAHLDKRPTVDPSAWIAPTAVLCGDVRVGPKACVAYGAILVAEGAPITVGTQSIIREQAVLRAIPGHPLSVGSYVLVGPRSALYGCTIEDEAFLATGSTIFHGARVGHGAEVRINGVVHVNSTVPPDGLVPIGWVAVGTPAAILPPSAHDQIWERQRPLNFPQVVYGVDREPDGSADMREITRRVADGLRRHGEDHPVSDEETRIP